MQQQMMCVQIWSYPYVTLYRLLRIDGFNLNVGNLD